VAGGGRGGAAAASWPAAAAAHPDVQLQAAREVDQRAHHQPVLQAQRLAFHLLPAAQARVQRVRQGGQGGQPAGRCGASCAAKHAAGLGRRRWQRLPGAGAGAGPGGAGKQASARMDPPDAQGGLQGLHVLLLPAQEVPPALVAPGGLRQHRGQLVPAVMGDGRSWPQEEGAAGPLRLSRARASWARRSRRASCGIERRTGFATKKAALAPHLRCTLSAPSFR
jgi:hypothetical protein